jgi:hypothetical protein
MFVNALNVLPRNLGAIAKCISLLTNLPRTLIISLTIHSLAYNYHQLLVTAATTLVTTASWRLRTIVKINTANIKLLDIMPTGVKEYMSS